MSSPHRRNTDVTKLIESEHEVTILGGLDDIVVKFYGPNGTPYEGGLWKVCVRLPEQYPFKPPTIRFINKIFHPNISMMFGTVCLDVIKHAWTEKYNLSMIFEYFLPQLLTEPNPYDSLNWFAADMYLNRPEEYKKVVSEHVQNQATEEQAEEALRQAEATDDSSASDFFFLILTSE